MPHRRDQRNRAGGSGTNHSFVVEGHQIFQAAAAPRDNDQVRAGQIAVERVEPGDGRRDLRRSFLALHRHRPQQHPAREARVEAMHDVLDDRAGGRSDHADHLRQERQFLLARRIEQPLAKQPLAALYQQRHQRALPRQLHLLDDHLVARRTGIGGDAAGADHIHALLRLQADGAGRLFPDDGV